MTARLYYDDPYSARFAARVVESLQWDGRPAVVLDRTAFYPSGGGQPHDLGRIGDASVLDVITREADGAVVHVLAQPLEAGGVEGWVNWERRFDLMQQHTGQHILSAAFAERLAANTVGFHLSLDYATIDLDQAPISADDLAGAELLANRIVFQNRRVVTRFVHEREVADLPLRKPLPPGHSGLVRVVEITGFDCSACGGTHVRATGEVGLIKIIHSERRGVETRVEFLCGGRALADYAAKNALVKGLAQEFTVSHRELADTVHRLADELKEARRELRRTRDALLDAEASALWHQAASAGRFRVVRAHFLGRAPEDLKHLAQRLVAHPGTVVLLGTEGQGGERSYLTFARSDDLDLPMATLVQQASEMIGGRGGGRPNFAQAGGPEGCGVARALDEAFRCLTA